MIEPGRLVMRTFVAGRARTKGHMQPVHIRGTNGRPCTFGNAKDRPLTQAWMRTLGRALQAAAGVRLARVAGKVQRVDGGAPYAEAVEVYAFFRFEREQAVVDGHVTAAAWESHDTPWPSALSIGDIDTLWRAINDALVKSAIILDDRLVIGGAPYKRWCLPGEEAGVLIVVTAAPEVEALLALESVSEDIE